MSIVDADVFLLAAGLGKRLRPITDSIPKPLVQVQGKPLLDYSLEIVARAGVRRVIINTHYLADQIKFHVGSGQRFGMEVVFSHEDELLETGGGIKNIEPLLQHDQLITINSDSLFGPDFRLEDVLKAHVQRTEHAEITAVLRPDPESKRYGEIGIDSEGYVTSFLGKPFGHRDEIERLMYAGIQVLDRSIVSQMPGPGVPFSVTAVTWQNLLAEGRLIAGFRYLGYWNDVGTPERLDQASKDVTRVFERGSP